MKKKKKSSTVELLGELAEKLDEQKELTRIANARVKSAERAVERLVREVAYAAAGKGGRRRLYTQVRAWAYSRDRGGYLL